MPDDRQVCRNSNGAGHEMAVQFINLRNRLVAESDYDIAFAQAGPCGRTSWLDAGHQDAVGHRQMMEPDDPGMNGNVLPGHADPTAPNAAFLDQPGGDELRRIAGDGKTNSLRRQNDRSIDTNDFAEGVDE